jgi:hypothetical protein
MDNLRSKIRSSYIETLYFVDKYLLDEKQLNKQNPEYMGYLVVFQEDSEPYQIAKRILNSDIGLSITKKFGYLMYYQDDRDIVVKTIF